MGSYYFEPPFLETYKMQDSNLTHEENNQDQTSRISKDNSSYSILSKDKPTNRSKAFTQEPTEFRNKFQSSPYSERQNKVKRSIDFSRLINLA